MEQAAETHLASIAPPRAENDVASVGGDAMEECWSAASFIFVISCGGHGEALEEY